MIAGETAVRSAPEDLPDDFFRARFDSGRRIHDQVVVFRRSPFSAGDVPVIRRSRPVRTADISFGPLRRVPVHLSHSPDTEIERRAEEYPEHVVVSPQHIIGNPSHDDAASVIRDLLDDPDLRFHGIVYGMGDQERPIQGWGVFVGGSSEYVYI